VLAKVEPDLADGDAAWMAEELSERRSIRWARVVRVVAGRENDTAVGLRHVARLAASVKIYAHSDQA
jgi:hypothetical protein